MLSGKFSEELETMMGNIEIAILGRKGDRSLGNPFASILPVGKEPELYADVGRRKHPSYGLCCSISH